jgi:hypothetical protein
MQYLVLDRQVYEEAWKAVQSETAPYHPLHFNDWICSSEAEAVLTLRNAKRWL